ncbi:MAG: F-type H+-transporting ATPase subunit gamma [Cellvibrionaceae bacterium]|jgi:F-type H+-transporting ATPase subunit gamma
MSKRRVLRERQIRLEEIKSIINAMKNLAFLETRKLDQRLDNLKNMLADTKALTADFLHFFSPAAANAPLSSCLWVAFGSERGFCGDFNKTLLAVLKEKIPANIAKENPVIAVGSRLHSLFELNQRSGRRIAGASVAEDILPMLTGLVDCIDLEQQKLGPDKAYQVVAIYHDIDSNRVESLALLPPSSRSMTKDVSFREPPLTNLAPDVLYGELIQQYLFVALQEIATVSLMTENQRRLQHMDGATQYLEKTGKQLSQRYQQLRQEAITEEIAVSMSNY